MRASQSQLPFVTRAEALASLLKSVERNVFLSIVADFLTDPRSEPAHLMRMLELLGKGSGNQLKRSGTFGDQALVVVQHLPSILNDENLSPAVLRSILGWTSRLLKVRSGKNGEDDRRPPGLLGGGGLQPRRPANQMRPTKPLRPVSHPTPPPAQAGPSAPEAPNWKARIQGLGWGNAGSIVSVLLGELKGDVRREAAKAIIEKMGGKKEFKGKKDKAWVLELFEAAGD
jgi:hypothetical protein